MKATINGQPVWQIREVLAHNSFQTQNDLRQHVGLTVVSIDSLEIRWPSGLVQQFGTQEVNRFYNITEGEPPVDISVGIVSPSKKNLHLKCFPTQRQIFLPSGWKIGACPDTTGAGSGSSGKKE